MENNIENAKYDNRRFRNNLVTYILKMKTQY